MGEVGRKLHTVLFLVICSDKSLARPSKQGMGMCVREKRKAFKRGTELRANASVEGHKHTGNP